MARKDYGAGRFAAVGPANGPLLPGNPSREPPLPADWLSSLVTALADRFTFVRELGQGGMATVYLAEDRKLRRPVAVKLLRPEIAAALGARRFLQEIEIAARLSHPHILPLHDSGEAGGTLY
jgi:serine/threonine protein kinase